MSEISLHWHDEETGEENLLNLVITRKGRLAGLTGAFVRLHPDSNKLEMSVQLDFKDFITLTWPLMFVTSPSELAVQCPILGMVFLVLRHSSSLSTQHPSVQP